MARVSTVGQDLNSQQCASLHSGGQHPRVGRRQVHLQEVCNSRHLNARWVRHHALFGRASQRQRQAKPERLLQPLPHSGLLPHSAAGTGGRSKPSCVSSN